MPSTTKLCRVAIKDRDQRSRLGYFVPNTTKWCQVALALLAQPKVGTAAKRKKTKVSMNSIAFAMNVAQYKLTEKVNNLITNFLNFF